MASSPTHIRLLKAVVRRHVLQQARWSSYSTGSYKNTAPVVRLRQSYLHRPGVVPLSADTLGDVVDRTAAEHGSQPAAVFVHQDIRKTWSDIKYEADRLAAALLCLGMQRGDRVGIWATNLYEWLLTQYAAAKAGLCLVNVNQAYQTHELEYCLQKVGVRTLIAADGYKTSDYYHMLTTLLPELLEAPENVPLKIRSESLPELRHIVTISQYKKPGTLRFCDLMDTATEAAMDERNKMQASVDCGQPASIQFTSGTTGLPKGATLTHHNMVNNVLSMSTRVGLDQPRQKICVSVPLYHCFGCVLGAVTAAVYGHTLVFPSQTFHGGASVKAAQDERCEWMYGTPTMFVDMVNLPSLAEHDISSLRGGVIAGAPVPYQLMEDMINKLGLRDAVVAYGLTETSPLVTTGFPTDSIQNRCGTVGFPSDHNELKVIDENGGTVPTGTPGQLCARGYNTMLGYWADEQKTKESFTADGWFLTGDIAVMTDEGYIKIVGRAKDMVIRGGENIYPAEIEDFLGSHPDILEAYAFGIPDERMGEELCVWIRTGAPDVLTEHDIREFCKGEIAHYKIPRYIQFRDDFPKTVTGKIQKYLLRETMAKELGITTKVF